MVRNGLRRPGVLLWGVLLLFFAGEVFAEERRALVLAVLDGDTAVVRGEDGSEETVRYLHIDTPELHHPRRREEELGPEAREANRSLVEGRWVRLVTDVVPRDRYGRLLARVVVDSPPGSRGRLRRAGAARSGAASDSSAQRRRQGGDPPGAERSSTGRAGMVVPGPGTDLFLRPNLGGASSGGGVLLRTRSAGGRGGTTPHTLGSAGRGVPDHRHAAPGLCPGSPNFLRAHSPGVGQSDSFLLGRRTGRRRSTPDRGCG